MHARSIYNTARHFLGRALRNHPSIKSRLAAAENRIGSMRDAAALYSPGLIKPRPYVLMVAVTAQCNSRCLGCRYGRDFMVGERLSFEIVKLLLDDAKEAGFYSVRFYGGEPLLHPQIASMVRYARSIGLHPYITSNGVLLSRHIDELVEAGLQELSVGFYGVGEAYDSYTQTKGLFKKVEKGIASVRERYGSLIKIQMNWLLHRLSCSVESLHAAHDFAERYDMRIQIDLVHYSLPYFTEGPDRMLQFKPEDRLQIQEVTDEMLRLKTLNPERFRQPKEGLRSIPDWLIKGPAMKVPCLANNMLWVGADGTVQLCYVTFKLGNLHQQRLKELLFTREHIQASRDAFALNCPNCHCGADERIVRHGPSRRLYSSERRQPVTCET